MKLFSENFHSPLHHCITHTTPAWPTHPYWGAPFGRHAALGLFHLNGGHFSKFLYLALLSTWLNLEPSYLAQLCTYTGATHREENIHLSIIFLKLWILKKIHILHFWLIGKHAKDTKFISGIPHTDTCTHTDRDTIFGSLALKTNDVI